MTMGVLYSYIIRSFRIENGKKRHQNQLQNSFINIQNYILVKRCRSMRKIGKNMQNFEKICETWQSMRNWKLGKSMHKLKSVNEN